MAKKSIILLQLVLFLGISKARAQEDLFTLIREDTEPEKMQLLPEKTVFTQRLLWGEKGLL